jgi:drug/metabolite transporter (DMT)-like permease
MSARGQSDALPTHAAKTRDRSALSGTIFCFASAVGFSYKSILIKFAYAYHVDASTLLTLRMGFALPFFLAMAAWAGRSPLHARLTRRQWLGVLILGFSGYYLAAYLDFLGLKYISASLERLTLFLYPTIVVILSAVILKRPIRRYQAAALAISYVGIALVFGEHMGEAHANSDFWLGSALVFTSGFIYSCYLIGSEGMVGAIGPVRFTAYAMSVACVLTFTQFVLTHPLSALDLPAPVYGLTFVMATLSTVLPAWLMSEGLRRVGANQAALVSSIGPVVTIALGYIFLNEPMSAQQLFGAALVLAGVTIVTLRRTAKTAGA